MAETASVTGGSGRLDYAGNLRVALIALVIAHHVGQAYGPTGGCWPIQEPARREWIAGRNEVRVI